MGLFTRLRLLFASKFSKLIGKVENPADTLDYSYEQMQQQLQNVKRGIADVVTAKKRLEFQTLSIQNNVVKLETQARQALAANREDLARQALERKAVAQQQLQGLEGQVGDLQDQQDKLLAGQATLQGRIDGFRSQKEVLKAQYSAAEASVRIGEAATGIGKGMANTGLAIERAQNKIQDMSARASAIDELTAAGALEDFSGSGSTNLDRELAQVAASGQVTDELAKMKAELGTGTEAPALEQ